MLKASLRQNRFAQLLASSLSCVAIFASSRQIASINRELFSPIESGPPLKLHIISKNTKFPNLANITKNNNIIFILVNSCIKCSTVVLTYARNIESAFASKGFEVILMSDNSQIEINRVLPKSSWPHGKALSNNNLKIFEQLGSPDLPQIAVFESGRFVFSGQNNESLRQSLHGLCVKYNISPKKVDENSVQTGVVPCSKN